MIMPTTMVPERKDPVEPGRLAPEPAVRRSRPAAPAERVQPSLLAEVQQHGKFDASCLNCGGCSVVCDLTAGDVTFPRRSIHLVVLGLKGALLEGMEPWLCHDCGDCSVTCPRQADPAASMRTLRRYLTGQYDWTGLGSKVLRSPAWHFGLLGAVAAVVLALIVLYHVYWPQLPLRDFATTAMGMEHMFPLIIYFTWVVYALPALVLFFHGRRMYRFAFARSRPPLRHFIAEAKTLFVHVVTQAQMRSCPTEALGAPVVGWWLYAGSAEAVPRRWLKHWLMAFGTVMMLVITAFFLHWFQTDTVHAFYHPQRLLGYVAAVFILWGTTDHLVRRARRPKTSTSREQGELTLPLLLWLTAVSGIVLHALRLLGFELGPHYAYAIHLAICVPMVLVEVPFGEWAHMIDRPLALYFEAVRERARREPSAEAGLAPVQT